MFIFVSRTRTRTLSMGCLNAQRSPLRRHDKSPVTQHGGHSPAGSNGRGTAMSDVSEGIDPHAIPSGTGCVECLAAGQWWFHLRRCAKCGHIGCCDTSPDQHATAHFRETGHFIVTSFEPGEDWFWNYGTGKPFYGPRLALPRSRPLDQPSPGPKGRVPADWENQLNV